MKTFEQFLNESITLNPKLNELINNWEQDGIKIDAYISANDIILSKLIIPSKYRNQGIGTKIIQKLLQFAGTNNMRVLVTPSTDFGASSKARLESFYKKLGFKKNHGKTRDYTTRETMIWEPSPHVTLD